MKFLLAKEIAIKAGEHLLPHCERLNIAGSVRRLKPDVNDIELICVPKRLEMPAVELFAPPVSVVHPDFVSAVAGLGEAIKGKPGGRYMRIDLKGIELDLFMPQADDYFRQFAIRTGPSDYSHNVIAAQWSVRGWCGTPDGLRAKIDCQERISAGAKSWVCVNADGQKPPVWESEEQFFEWLGLAWVHPKNRV